MKYLVSLLVLLASPAFAQTTPTRVQQLQSWIDYDEEYLEYHPCTACYTAYHLQRAIKNLAIAQAAAAAGTPLAPFLLENGQVAPLFPAYVGTGQTGGTPSGGASRGTE